MSSKTYYVTFGGRYAHETHPRLPEAHPDGWVEIVAYSETAARLVASHYLGIHWAFMYTDKTLKREYFPRGCLAIFREPSDADRLRFLMADIDSFQGQKFDRYDLAMEIALNNGHDEPNEEDELNGFRALIDYMLLVKS